MGQEGNNPNPTPNTEPTGDDDVLDKFKKIKEQYETELSDKDKEIAELKEQLKKKESEVDDTISDLNDEVKDKLKQADEIKNLQETVDQLIDERAEATVDAYIQKGVILPSQKEAAKKLCLRDNDTFLDLYREAKPIVDLSGQKSKPVPTELVGQMTNYFK